MNEEQLDDVVNRPTNSYFPSICKRHYFEDEQEVRAVLSPSGGGILYASFHQDANKGIGVPVNLDVLIEAIYVGPGADNSFFELVRSLVSDRFAVERSGMDDMPPRSSGDSSEQLEGGFFYPEPPDL